MDWDLTWEPRLTAGDSGDTLETAGARLPLVVIMLRLLVLPSVLSMSSSFKHKD